MKRRSSRLASAGVSSGDTSLGASVGGSAGARSLGLGGSAAAAFGVASSGGTSSAAAGGLAGEAAGGPAGAHAAGHPEESALVKVLKGPCSDQVPRMPNGCTEADGNCVPDDYIAAVEQWISDGANRP